VVILAVSFFGTTLSNTFNFITNNIPNA